MKHPWCSKPSTLSATCCLNSSADISSPSYLLSPPVSFSLYSPFPPILSFSRSSPSPAPFPTGSLPSSCSSSSSTMHSSCSSSSSLVSFSLSQDVRLYSCLQIGRATDLISDRKVDWFSKIYVRVRGKPEWQGY